jgi:D-alanyl-lipoteichoic acid acyltransferase DltB (MBOAT superfamily)
VARADAAPRAAARGPEFPRSPAPLLRARAQLARLGGLPFLVVLAELALCAAIAWKYQLQSKAFLKVLLIAFPAFPLYRLLPERARLPAFSLLSLAAIAWVLGIENALWIVGLGLGLVALAHAPAAFPLRIAALCLVGLLLAGLRAGWLAAPIPSPVWPILGSMFMFRLLVYLYDLRTRAAPFGFWRAAAYFFMLPNVCFPLFPIVDYKTFCRTQPGGGSLESAQRGAAWMFRGLLHLILYRIVQRHLLVDPLEVRGSAELARFLVANFLLYLRVSGDFHLIVGILQLFGFALPETNHLYALSSSLTEFWRRINIYWRDFMEKLFFRPIYFRARRGGEAAGIALATLGVFAATWLLHSYQAFWIRGAFPFAWQDLAFWSVFGACMVANVLLDARRPRQRTLGAASRGWASQALGGLRAVAVFAFLVTLWSLWSAESWDGWLATISQVRFVTARDAAILALAAAALAFAAIAFGSSPRDSGLDRGAASPGAARFWRSAAAVAVPAALLAALGARPGAFVREGDALAWIEALKANRPTAAQAKAQERGYYEELANATRIDNEMAKLFFAPLGWNKESVFRKTGGFPERDLIPAFRGSFNEQPWSTNRWGMRDRDYELAKPPGTFRIGLFGASHDVGVGVADGEAYESVLELGLDREPDGSGRRYEVLNFSVNGYGPYERLIAIRRQAARFDLDLVLYVVVNDLDWMVRDVVSATLRGGGVPDPAVAAVVERAGVAARTAPDLAEHRLAPHASELLAWLYAELARMGREGGAPVVALLLPKPERETGWREELAPVLPLLSRAGIPTLDATRAYDGVARLDELWAAPWDKHPNARGHRLLAEAIRPELLRALAATRPAGPGSGR